MFKGRGFIIREPPDKFENQTLVLNIIALTPGVIVMAECNLNMVEFLEKNGIQVFE